MKRYLTLMYVAHDDPEPDWGYHLRMGDLDIDDEDVRHVATVDMTNQQVVQENGRSAGTVVKCGYPPCDRRAENPSNIEAEWFCSATHRSLARRVSP